MYATYPARNLYDNQKCFDAEKMKFFLVLFVFSEEKSL
jgi:hypothetical protein